MKRVLVAGAGSYIGASFAKYAAEHDPNGYSVDTVDLIDGTWREASFSGYDAVLHVAGIVHRREAKRAVRLYYEVNRDLTADVAEKAKREGVGHFIFMSSMSVYGRTAGEITPATAPRPNTHYSKSKYEAEGRLSALADDRFGVCVIRSPMVYGKGCKGNFHSLLKVIQACPVFPAIENRRSMIYIDNLCAFIQLAIEERCVGVYCPQDREYVCVSRMAERLARAMGKRLRLSKTIGWCARLLLPLIPRCRKAFGSLVYSGTERNGFAYCVVDQDESFRRSV